MSSLTSALRERSLRDLAPVAIPAGLLLGLAYLAYDGIGMRPLLMLAVGGCGLALILRPWLGIPALVIAATALPMELSTGTDVALNYATLLVPLLGMLWLVRGLLAGHIAWRRSPVDVSWVLLLLSGLLSLAIGRATWDPGVPVRGSFILVQLAQWAIYAFAALAFWLPGMIGDADAIRRSAWVLLFFGGTLALLRLLPLTAPVAASFTTAAFYRAPFLVLLTGVAGGQLFFNEGLSVGRRAFLAALLLALVYQSTFEGRLSVSEWVGVWAVLAVLVWQRFPRLRWVALTVIVVLLIAGILFPSLYEFAGGQLRWEESGASRLLLIERVLRATERNPLTGLGPAAYRPYTSLEPLRYGSALWFYPQVNSHNNYVDVYSFYGIVGLGLFLWFAVSLWRQLAAAVARTDEGSFAHGYTAGMLAVWIASLVIMLLADWMLPSVYNIGFEGFQASLLAWLFLGGVAVFSRAPGVEA
ncbi:MAG: O-antigen ligase family protein [Chloroflexi bacterium]|nr:O-antigen ligase family protein [Chloroflexota bacterium]